MIKRQLTPFEWLQFSTETQNLFKETFHIPRSSGTIVTDNRVESDGHTIEDLSVVNPETLQEYLGTKDDHWDNLLELTINKMQHGEDTTSEVTEPVGVSRRGRKKKTQETV